MRLSCLDSQRVKAPAGPRAAAPTPSTGDSKTLPVKQSGRSGGPAAAVLYLCLLPILVLSLNGCGLFGSRSNALGLAAAKTARQCVGTPYRLGGHTPKEGLDCSGLTSYVYGRHGVKLPPSSAKQAKMGRFVKKPYLQPGDLIFFSTGQGRQVSHVGIYIGDGKFIHAPGTGKTVTTATLDSVYFQKVYHSARRPR